MGPCRTFTLVAKMILPLLNVLRLTVKIFLFFYAQRAQFLAHFSAATVNPIKTLREGNPVLGLRPSQAENHPADCLLFLLATPYT